MPGNRFTFYNLRKVRNRTAAQRKWKFEEENRSRLPKAAS
jgi:hypothetical protein